MKSIRDEAIVRSVVKGVNKSNKRAVWNEIQTHLPELAARMQRINQRLGPIASIKVTTKDKKLEWRKE